MSSKRHQLLLPKQPGFVLPDLRDLLFGGGQNLVLFIEPDLLLGSMLQLWDYVLRGKLL